MELQMSDTMQTARELAIHETEIKHLQNDMDKLVNDMDEIKEAVQRINKLLAEAKGGWQMLMMVGGFGAAVGGAVAWVVETFVGKH
jgi:prefoldin subunit 5